MPLDEIRFAMIIASNFTDTDVTDAVNRQVDAFATDAVDSLATYVEAVGAARVNGGWSWS
jgi:hypothetical protein